jgi:hypothetical protein
MELQEIDVVIEKDGTVRLAVRGVKGMACLELTGPLETALGGTIESRTLTPEAGDAVVRDEAPDRRRGTRGR